MAQPRTPSRRAAGLIAFLARRWVLAALAVAVVVGGGSLAILQLQQPSSNVPTPGTLTVQRSTLHSIGFLWDITGDANRDAAVAVRYREQGATLWKAAQPLMREDKEVVARANSSLTWVAPNRFGGSVLDLTPGTAYDVELSMTDPDRPGWTDVMTRTVSTRPDPVDPTGGATRHVFPSACTSSAPKPCYVGLRAAYAAAQPGDIILVHRGVYTIPATQTIGRADYVLTKPGTPSRPIVIKGAGDGAAVFDGNGAGTLFQLRGADYTYFEKLVMRGADKLINAQGKGPTGIVVRGLKMSGAAIDVYCGSPTCRDFTITDNSMVGRLTFWTPRCYDKTGACASNPGVGTHAIWLSGQGHAVEHNTISRFWDGIDILGRLPSADLSKQNASIDFDHNTLSSIMDDGMELDYGVSNIRAYGNFIYNTFMGISTQPIFGGPAYILRNVVYNATRAPLKLNLEPSGLLIFNNTFLVRDGFRAEVDWSNSRIENNLFLGVDGLDDGWLWTGTETPKTSVLDYNGYRANKTKDPARQIWWRSPEEAPKPREHLYPTLQAFAAATGFETHGVNVDYDIFASAVPASGLDRQLPAGLNLQLRPGSVAVDAGAVIPNITDGFTGRAPDLGAFELNVSAAGVTVGCVPQAAQCAPCPTQMSASPVTDVEQFASAAGLPVEASGCAVSVEGAASVPASLPPAADPATTLQNLGDAPPVRAFVVQVPAVPLDPPQASVSPPQLP